MVNNFSFPNLQEKDNYFNLKNRRILLYFIYNYDICPYYLLSIFVGIPESIFLLEQQGKESLGSHSERRMWRLCKIH